MKNVSKLFAGLLMLAAMAGSFSSCSPVEPYQPEPVPEGLQLYFPTTVLASTYDINELTGDKIDITVCRVKCDEAATVNISSTVDAPAGAITVPASVDFGYLATEAHLLISLDKTLIPLDSEAKVELSIPDAANVGTFGDTKFIVTIKNPTPQLWIKFDDGIIYETPYWGEEEAKTMYYMEYAENIRLCKVEKCFGAETIKGGGSYDVQDYLWYWNTKTNECYVPWQYMGYSNSNGKTWFCDESSFYNFYWGYVKQSQAPLEEGSPEWFAFCDKFRAAYPEDYYPYYDGNGGFYLADYYLAGYPKDGTYLGQYTGGDGYDSFIGKSFTRTTDYNKDFDYQNLYKGVDDSEVFEQEFDCLIAQAKKDSTVYYIPDYFAEGSGLAFIIPAEQYDEQLGRTFDGATITKGENEQYTGVMQWGYEMVANIAKKSVLVWPEDQEYPEYDVNVSLDLYTVEPAEEEGEDPVKTLAFEVGTFMDKITATGTPWYTYDDIRGLNKQYYCGDFYLYGTDPDDGKTYYWPVSISDAGSHDGTSWVNISNFLPMNPAFMDADANVLEVEWYNGDGCLYFTAGTTFAGDFVYGGDAYPVIFYIMNSKTFNYYGEGYLIGGYHEDSDTIVCVDWEYNEGPVDGFYASAYGFGGLMYYCNLQFVWNEGDAIAHGNSFATKDALKIKKSVMNAGKFSYAKTQLKKSLSTAKPITREGYTVKDNPANRSINMSNVRRIENKKASETLSYLPLK